MNRQKQMCEKGPSFRHIARTAVLRKHGIESRIVNGRLEALSVCTGLSAGTRYDWVDVTDYTTRDFYQWLGY
jgi:hypothetical protein